jgi:hypothetical protein
MKQGNFKLSKRKPEVKGLNNNAIHKEIMGRILVNYGSKLLSAHRVHDDVTLPTGTRQLDGPPKGLDTIRRMEFGFGKHHGSRRFKEHQFLPCERRTGNYYTIAIVTLRTTVTLYNRKT